MSSELSSEVLVRQFGNLELEILNQDDRERIICNRTVPDGRVIELSKVAFRQEGVAAFPEIHQRILRGASIGAAFAEASVPFHREIHASRHYEDEVPSSFAERFGSQEPPTVTDLSVLVGADNIPYADILEVYNPAVVPWEQSPEKLSATAISRLHEFGATLANIA